jgi:hypothetical protein
MKTCKDEYMKSTIANFKKTLSKVMGSLRNTWEHVGGKTWSLEFQELFWAFSGLDGCNTRTL